MFPQDLPPATGGRHHIVIGITGGIACGKSTAAAYFHEAGFGGVDCDEVVRDLLAGSPEVCHAVRERFGDPVMNPDGSVNRGALAEVVFSSVSELDWLESLLHPKVLRIWREKTASAPGRRWVVQIPLLFEKRLEKYVDLTVCVAVAPFVQRKRLRLRGMSDDQANSRIYRQLPMEEKMVMSDHVILNDGSKRFLREQAVELIDRL